MNSMVTGDVLGDCTVTLPINRDVYSTLDTAQLAHAVRLGRVMVARLSAEVDELAAELARRDRGSLIQIHTAAALDVAEVMRRTGMSRQWVYRASRRGGPLAGCCRRQGRRRVWDADKLARWCDRQRAG